MSRSLFLAFSIIHAIHAPVLCAMSAADQDAAMDFKKQLNKLYTGPTIRFVRAEFRNAGFKKTEQLFIYPADHYTSHELGIGIPVDKLHATICEKNNRKLETDADLARWHADVHEDAVLYDLYKEVLRDQRVVNNPPLLKKLAREELDQQFHAARASLFHEGGHHENNDWLRDKERDQTLARVDKGIELSGAGSCTAALFAHVTGFLPKLNAPLTTGCVSLLGMRLASQATKKIVHNAYARQQEWDADEKIPQDPVLLRAAAESYRRDDRDSRLRLKYTRAYISDNFNTNPVANTLFSNHPPHNARFRRFIVRAQAAEQGKTPSPRQAACVVS